ncbi:hypothetical protein [Sphaerisporangium aureirubrum]|uniref:Uncharacterized protein n=1 Tax=Sphaerisporangium aureirubrum TaxID=1544736 RepID=A0ABW1NCG6_9ACTN
MSERAAYIRGLWILAKLYADYPTLPPGWPAQEINLHQYGRTALPLAEQMYLAVAVIERMDAPAISLHLNRGAPTAWLFVRGDLAGLPVRIKMWADDVCERRPQERLKRDRWVWPPAVVNAVKARTVAAANARTAPDGGL